MLPDLVPEGGALPVLARGVSVAALFVAFGTALLPLVAAVPPDRRLRRLALAAMLLAALATLGWAVLVAGDMADADGPAALAAAVPDVLSGTHFGHLVLIRVALLGAGALAMSARRRWLAPALLAGALLTQSGHSHAATMYGGPSLLWAAEFLHIAAAAAWLGGLPGLLLVLATQPPPIAALACRRFGTLALVCVAAIAATALAQASVVIGSWAGLVGTGFGWVALAKLLLLGVLIGFGARHRLRLVPALPEARGQLLRSLTAESAVGLLVVLVAAYLSSLPPSMHLQPIWPLPWMLSLTTLREAPEFAPEAYGAAAMLGAGVAACLAGLAWRAGRWPLLVAGALAAGLALPHLDLFVVEAAPTTFYHSPTGFAADAIMRGATLVCTELCLLPRQGRGGRRADGGTAPDSARGSHLAHARNAWRRGPVLDHYPRN